MNLVILWIHDFFIWISLQKILKKIVALEHTFSMPYHTFQLKRVKVFPFDSHTLSLMWEWVFHSLTLHWLPIACLTQFCFKTYNLFHPKKIHFVVLPKNWLHTQDRITTPQWSHIMVLDKGNDGKNTCCIMLFVFCNLFLLHILCVLQLIILFEKFVTYKNTLKWHKIGSNNCFRNAKTTLTKEIWGPISYWNLTSIDIWCFEIY